MKTLPMTSMAVLCTAMVLAIPCPAQDATANSTLSFTNISITPGAGAVDILTNFSGAAYAQATVTTDYQTGTSPSATAVGDYSTASGSATSSAPGGQSSASASVTGAEADNASGQSWLTSSFMITGGSGNVSVLFGAQLNGSLDVFTDANGQLAMAEGVFSLELNGTPALFTDQYLSIGPGDSQSQPLSGPLSGSMALQYNTVYVLYAEADAEVSVSSVPEPGVTGLLAAGLVALLWTVRRKIRAHRKGVSALLLLLGLGGVAQATYIAADVPDVCQTCGAKPTRQPGGTVGTSLTEGNLREEYPVTTLSSSTGPTLDLSLVYNTYNADGSRMELDAGLGIGWTHSYNQYLFIQRGSFFLLGGDGRITLFKYNGPSGYTADNGYFESLNPQADGSLIVSNQFQTWWRFASVPGTRLLVGGAVYNLVQMGDRNGNLTTFSYSSGLLSKITDTYGRSLTLTYTNSHLYQVTDPLGRTTTLLYDARFRTPIRITDADGNVTRYTYNQNYQLTRKIDKDGRTYSYLYRNLKPWAVLDGNGQTYFSMQNSNYWAVDRYTIAYALRRIYTPSTVTNIDGNGNTWRYLYDTNGYVTEAIAPDSTTTRYTYDPLLRTLTSKTDPDGNTTHYHYDTVGNRTNITDALGNVTTYTYEPVYNQMTSMTDPNGRVTTYQYDAHGNRTNEIDPLLQTQTWTYDSHGNVLTSTDKDGHTTTYVYDAADNPTNITDALGNTTRYTYDAVGNEISTTDPLGRTTTYVYDGLNRIIDQTNALGGVTSYIYDGDGRQTSVTDPNENTTQYYYDQRGRLSMMIDAQGGETTYGYDNDNNQLAMTNQLGNATLYQYDTQNRRIGIEDALGHTTRNTYDAYGNTLTNIDNNGHPTSYTYDALNRKVTKTDALGEETLYDYSTPGGLPCCTATLGSSLVTRQQDADGNVTFYNYDELDRLVEVVKKQNNTNTTIGPSDAVTSYTYDPVGNRISLTDPVGNTTTYGYDALNRQVATTNAAGNTAYTSYDAVGNISTTTAINTNVTTYTYDGLNRRTSASDSAGVLRTNTYDAVGNLLSVTDGNGNTTRNAYDALNRPTNSIDPLGRPTTTTYDAVGNVITNIDRNQNTTRYQYDAINRRVTLYDALGNTTAFAYDAVGNLTNLTDPNGHITSYSYDSVNRRLTETYPDSSPNTVTYTYDAVGNLITRTDQKGQVTTYSYSQLYYMTNRNYLPINQNDTFTYDLDGRLLSADRGGWINTFGYDGANRLIYTTQNGELIAYGYDIEGRRQTNAYPSGRMIVGTTDGRGRVTSEQEGVNPPIVTYTYDAADRVLTRTNGNGTATTYVYDADDRVLSIETSNSVGLVVGFAYAYDYEGNRLAEEKLDSPGDSEAYAYDGLDRLTNYDAGMLSGVIVPSPGLAKAWSLDPVGNWNTFISNSITEIRTHGPANELLTIDSQSLSYDANGNLAGDSVYLYSYDEENRLIQVQRISDSAIVGSYYYDALGRRVIAITDPANNLATNVYYYDSSSVIEEQNGAGLTQATYVYGNYVDEVLTMNRGGQVYYYHQNAAWSPHALTDSSGNAVERYDYDAYGSVYVMNGTYNPEPVNAWGTPHSPSGNPYLFTGREFGEESGLYFYRARYYDTLKGRFLQRDPIDYGDGLNLYQYAHSSPEEFLDPSGMAVQEETYDVSLYPIVANINNLPNSMDVPKDSWTGSYKGSLWNIRNRWTSCLREDGPAYTETRDGTVSYHVYVFDRSQTSAPVVVPRTSGFGPFSTDYTRVGVYDQDCYKMYEVTFRIYTCSKCPALLFTYNYNVVEDKKDQGIVCINKKFRFSEYKGKLHIDAVEAAKIAAQFIK